MILEYLELNPSCEWFFWCDADAVIMDRKRRLEAFVDDNAEFIVGRDDTQINTGVFLIRNCRSAKQMLLDAWNDPGENLWNRNWEQDAIIRVLKRYGGLGLRVKVVPAKPFNVFANAYNRGDFIKHYTGHGVVKPERLESIDIDEDFAPESLDPQELLHNMREESKIILTTNSVRPNRFE